MTALKVGCSSAVNWIQTKTNLLRRFPPGARYLIGVSGGRDSVTLLDALVDLGYKTLIVCHLNHKLREASDADARSSGNWWRHTTKQLGRCMSILISAR
jgi:tRNA(Ile)-lysidine synthase TilS/MesJ